MVFWLGLKKKSVCFLLPDRPCQFTPETFFLHCKNQIFENFENIFFIL